MSPRKLAEQTFTATDTTPDAASTSTVVNMSTGPMQSFGLQVKATTITAWSLVLEGSLNGTNYHTILTHTEAAPLDGKIIWTTTKTPVKYARMRLVSKTGTGSLLCTFLGLPN